MRYFIGIRITEKSVLNKNIIEIQKNLLENNLVNPKRIVPANKLHLTCKFIGKIDNDSLEKIDTDLKQIYFKPFKVGIEPYVELFGGSRMPLLVIKTKSNENLEKLAYNINNIITNIIEDPEPNRKFIGHAAIVIRDPKNKKFELEYWNNEWQNKKLFNSFDVNKFELIESENGVYTTIATYDAK